MSEREPPLGAPAPGTPAFLAWVEHSKDEIERRTGVRPDVVEIGGDDDWRQAMRRQAAEAKKARRERRHPPGDADPD